VSGDVGYGEPPDPNDPWTIARKELTPDKSLARIGATAKFTVSTVAVVGVAVTGLGLITADDLRHDTLTSVLIVAVVACAMAAVTLALVYLIVRSEKVNLEDDERVKTWYDKQLKRTRYVTVASALLVLSVILATVTAIVALLQDREPPGPELALTVDGSGETRTIIAAAAVSDVDKGQTIALQVTGESAESSMILVDHQTLVGTAEEVSVETSAEDVPAFSSYVLELRIDDAKKASLTTRPGDG
jgi:amino acid transporter